MDFEIYAMNIDFWIITHFCQFSLPISLDHRKLYFRMPASQHAARRRYNGAFIECKEMGSAHQATAKWPIKCDNFHRSGIWPPGAVFGRAEQMMRLECTGAWDGQGSLFCERLKGKICSSCGFFPPTWGW